MSILLKDVLLDGKRTGILLDGNTIREIGEETRGDETIDCRGKAAIPGLINTHTHSAMTLLRGHADDMDLQQWLEKHIWPIEAKLTEDEVYWGARLACLEMIKTGTTCFNDMYWHLPGTAKAVEDSGIRAVLSSVFIDLFDPKKARQRIREEEKLVEGARTGDRIRLALGPHAIYTVSEESLRWNKAYADKKGLIIHIHLSETKKEVDDCIRARGKRPAEYLDEIGFLGPNVVCAHCVWLDREEMHTMGKRGAKVAHCPTSNMKLSVGAAMDYASLRKEGVTVSLGTDGASSNNSLDMFQSMKFAALLQKHHYNDTTLLPADEALKMATAEGAKALGLNAGAIREGALADIALIDLKRPEMTPLHHLASNIVYAANGGCVDTLICDGKVLMRGRIVDGEDDVLERTGKEASELTVRK
ncbi:MAG: amidohydrolase [Candidatus Altiarchaeota archaeon]